MGEGSAFGGPGVRYPGPEQLWLTHGHGLETAKRSPHTNPPQAREGELGCHPFWPQNVFSSDKST